MHYLDNYINWREQVSWSVRTTGLSEKTHVTSWVFWLPMKNVRVISHNHIHKDQNRFLSHEAKIARGQCKLKRIRFELEKWIGKKAGWR